MPPVALEAAVAERDGRWRAVWIDLANARHLVLRTAGARLSLASAQNMSPSGGVSGVQRRPPVVLIADDNESTRDTYADYLELLGCHVVKTADGAQALEIALARKLDLIILDIAMHTMDGCEVTRRLRRESRTKATPIVVVTGLGAHWRAEAVHAGADAFLVKPSLVVDFEQVIERLLPELRETSRAQGA